jgi:hypothetical protein
MFSVLVSANGDSWETGARMDMHASRFGEYSGEEAKPLSHRTPESLRALEGTTAILMYETGVDDPSGAIVRVGRVHDVRVNGSDISFRFAELGRIPRERVEENLSRLRMSRFELSRTHWAIKDGEFPPELIRDMKETPQRYDVVLSFAGEDRGYVEQVAEALSKRGVTFFYDKYEKASLWGKDLGEHLHEIYSKQSNYCLMFISSHYAEKVWTTHEKKAALSRAISEKTGYILPIRFDKTEIPGISSTIGYLDATVESPESVALLVAEKLGRA